MEHKYSSKYIASSNAHPTVWNNANMVCISCMEFLQEILFNPVSKTTSAKISVLGLDHWDFNLYVA